MGTFSPFVRQRGLKDSFEWACTGVYGSNEDIKRSQYRMNWLEFNNIGKFHGIALEILTLFVFQVSGWNAQD